MVDDPGQDRFGAGGGHPAGGACRPALQLRLLAHAERIDVGAGVGARSAANWLAHQTRTTRPALRRAARLAKRLEEAYPEADRALAAGG